jgi:hypothetical protein
MGNEFRSNVEAILSNALGYNAAELVEGDRLTRERSPFDEALKLACGQLATWIRPPFELTELAGFRCIDTEQPNPHGTECKRVAVDYRCRSGQRRF